MKYIKWLLLAILDLAFTVVCYVTNPIVVLFATSCGELPEIMKWWANWDDGLDVEWMVTEHHVPSFAEYDFNKHYLYVDEWQAEKVINHHHGFVIPKDMNFTFKEKLQRYICRCCWLYRNTGYGFSYYVTGVDVDENDIVKIKTMQNDGYIYYETDDAFCLKYEKHSFGAFHWEIFLGWKFQNVTGKERCMLAFRVNPFCKG